MLMLVILQTSVSILTELSQQTVEESVIKETWDQSDFTAQDAFGVEMKYEASSVSANAAIG
jgi:hypothetical protein